MFNAVSSVKPQYANSVCTIVKYCLSLVILMCHFRAAYIKLNMQWKLSNRYDFFYLGMTKLKNKANLNVHDRKCYSKVESKAQNRLDNMKRFIIVSKMLGCT